jgi:DNA polymerase III sliding clamp (beta) subunit (PCNA family)
MKIETTAQAFTAALKASLKPDTKIRIPVLQYVQLIAGHIISTDLGLTTIVDYPAAVAEPLETGFLLPYKQAVDVLAGESGPLTIAFTPATPIVPLTRSAHDSTCPALADEYDPCECGYADELEAHQYLPDGLVTLSVGECEYSFNVPTISHFPVTPAPIPASLTVDGKEFKTMLDRIIFAVSKEESRYTLNGALLAASGSTVEMVATDGHRLSRAVTHNGSGEIQALITLSALEWLAKQTGSIIEIGASSEYQSFSTPGKTLIAKPLHGSFPNYRAVMPCANPISAAFNAPAALAKTLARVAKCADSRSGAVKWTLNGSLELNACSSEVGSAFAILECPVTGWEAVEDSFPEHKLSLGLSAPYVLDFLKKLGDTPFIGAFRDAQSSALFSVPNWDYVIMPMGI